MALRGLARTQRDRAAAVAQYEEAAALFQALGVRWETAHTLYMLGNDLLPDYASAAPRFAESLALFRVTEHPLGIGRALGRLGYALLGQGDPAAAGPLLEESLARLREIGDRQGVGSTLTCLGDVARERGDYALAGTRYAESLATGHAWGYRQGIPGLLRRFVGLAATRGHWQRAVQLAAAEGALRAALGGSNPGAEQAQHEREVQNAREALGEPAAAAAWAAGQAMSVEQAVAFALEEPGDA
jgi:hypothetical protein